MIVLPLPPPSEDLAAILDDPQYRASFSICTLYLEPLLNEASLDPAAECFSSH
jgi:hypothetical protein